MQRVRHGSPLLLVLASSAVLGACASGDVPRGEARQGLANAPTPNTLDSSFAAQTSSGPALRGGQSGGEGNGALDDGSSKPVPSVPGGTDPDIDEGPAQSCACMNAASAGTVLSIGGGCARVQVTAVYDPSALFDVGDVIGGIFENTCVHADLSTRVGDEILFEYYPGRTDECPAYRQCADANCIGVNDPCREACRETTLAQCTDPLAWSLQTGRFSALLRQGETVSFHFAGQDRTASVEELTSPECWAEHRRILEEPGGLAARQSDRDNAGPDPSYDPVDCFEPEEQ